MYFTFLIILKLNPIHKNKPIQSTYEYFHFNLVKPHHRRRNINF